tara:strand:+ start:528 stop:1022 length:495 start_codon:yes stop_codon:yes gene_type:complete
MITEQQIQKRLRYKSIKEAAEALRVEYAKALCKFELKVQSGDRPFTCEKKKAIREYAMSTPNKRFFVMRNVLSNLEGKCISVEATRKLLGVSRAAMDTMVKDCFEAKWIIVDKNGKGHRRMKAQKITVEAWLDYSDYINNLVDEMNFVHLNSSRRAMATLLDTK